MSLLWLDGFDWFPNTLGATDTRYCIGKRYASNTFLTGNPDTLAGEGRQGGTAIRWQDTGQYMRTPILQTAGDSNKAYIGYALRTGSGWHSGSAIVSLYRLGSSQCYLRIYSDGTGQFFPGGALFDTTLENNRWYYIELYFNVHNSTGSAEMKVNGVSVHTDTNVDMQSLSSDGYTQVQMSSHGDDSRVDDWYVCNDQGTANNTFLGDTRVIMVKPNGDYTTDWTQSGVGSHYQDVDDQPITPTGVEVWTDTDYVEDNTTSNQDIFEYENLPSAFSGSTVSGVQLISVIRTTSAESMSFKDVCRSGATEVAVSTSQIMWDNYHPYWTIIETDPNTSAAWTQTNVDAAKFGVEVG